MVVPTATFIYKILNQDVQHLQLLSIFVPVYEHGSH